MVRDSSMVVIADNFLQKMEGRGRIHLQINIYFWCVLLKNYLSLANIKHSIGSKKYKVYQDCNRHNWTK